MLYSCTEYWVRSLDSYLSFCMIIYKITQVSGSCGFGGKGLNSIIKNCNELEDLIAKMIRILDGKT